MAVGDGWHEFVNLHSELRLLALGQWHERCASARREAWCLRGHSCEGLLRGCHLLGLLSENRELVFIRGHVILEPFFWNGRVSWLPESLRVAISAELALREGHEGLRLNGCTVRGGMEVCLRVES